jgi:hypothetical protein
MWLLGMVLLLLLLYLLRWLLVVFRLKMRLNGRRQSITVQLLLIGVGVDPRRRPLVAADHAGGPDQQDHCCVLFHGWRLLVAAQM